MHVRWFSAVFWNFMNVCIKYKTIKWREYVEEVMFPWMPHEELHQINFRFHLRGRQVVIID